MIGIKGKPMQKGDVEMKNYRKRIARANKGYATRPDRVSE